LDWEPVAGCNIGKLEESNLKKVLLIDNSVQESGAYHSIQCFINKLNSRINFYYAVPEGCWTRGKRIAESRLGVFRFIELSKNWSVIWYLPRLIINTLKIRKWIKLQAIEIVHVNDLYNMTGVCIKLLDPGIRLIYHVRLRRSSYVGPLFSFWIWVINKLADTIIPVSEAVERDLVVQSDKVRRIYDAVDGSWQFLKKDCDLSKQQVSFLYVSNFIPGKGQNYGLEAFKIARRHVLNITLQLVGTTGDHPQNEAYLGSLKRFVRDNQLQDSVTIVDRPSAIPDYMELCDVVLMFSESESFSLICLEALACGRPVIATKCGGPQEIIRHMTNGILVENRDITAMAAAMVKLASGQDLIRKFSDNARIDFNRKFNPDVLAEELYEVYHF